MLAQVADRCAGVQALGHLHNRVFAHAKRYQVGFAVQQDRAPNLVAPIVVVCQPSQRRFDAAGDDGHARIGLTRSLAIRQRRPIWTQANPATRRVGVVVADLAVGRVVVDHRVHVAGADRKEQSRPTKPPPILAASPIGLADHAHSKTGRFQRRDPESPSPCWGDRCRHPRSRTRHPLVPIRGPASRAWSWAAPPGVAGHRPRTDTSPSRLAVSPAAGR